MLGRLNSWSIAIGAVAIAAAVAGAQPSAAQSPVARAEDSYRREIVRMLEQILFKLTSKTTTVIYAKRYDIQGGKSLFCGAARFGSTPQMFTLDTETSAFTRGASKAQWSGAGCEGAGYETLIDLR
jgi:hypothetical protein